MDFVSKILSRHGQSDSGHGFSRRSTAPNSSGLGGSKYQTGQPSRGSDLYNPTDEWIRETTKRYIGRKIGQNNTTK